VNFEVDFYSGALHLENYCYFVIATNITLRCSFSHNQYIFKFKIKIVRQLLGAEHLNIYSNR